MEEEMKCKDCKHWEDGDEYDLIMHPLDPDTYNFMEMPFKVFECKNPNITLFERNPNSNGVSLCDGSDYKAKMYTGEDFGCINAEKKGS
jgi:hypothetical protein